ncbi:MAG TPA: hypothetical protein VGF20_01865, partial [Candidatus Acidoferrum sp.]
MNVAFRHHFPPVFPLRSGEFSQEYAPLWRFPVGLNEKTISGEGWIEQGFLATDGGQDRAIFFYVLNVDLALFR